MIIVDPTLKLAIWQATLIGNTSRIFYAENELPYPLSGTTSGWFHIKNGVTSAIEPPEQVRFEGPWPWGFYEATAESRLNPSRSSCPLGRILIRLETRDFTWEKPTEIGTLVKTLAPYDEDRFPNIPFEIYARDGDAQSKYEEKRQADLARYEEGIDINDIAPDAFIYVSVELDGTRVYTRTLPWFPINHLKQVKALITEQLKSVIKSDNQWLERYLHYENLRMNGKDHFKICAEIPT